MTWTSLIAAEILLFVSTGPINSALVGQVPKVARAAAMAGSILTIHLLGDVPSPFILGRISERTSLAEAVLIIPVAIAVSRSGLDLRRVARGPRDRGACVRPRGASLYGVTASAAVTKPSIPFAFNARSTASAAASVG